MGERLRDSELKEFLNITDAQLELVKKNATPEQMKTWKMMYDTYNELMLWQAGAGPFPKGVMVD